MGVRDEASHPGAGIADAAPHAGALDHVGFVFGVGAVLRALQIIETLPARLRAAERLPIELDIETLGGEVPLLHGDEVIESHALGRDFYAMQLSGHADPPADPLPILFLPKHYPSRRPPATPPGTRWQ